MSQEDLYTAVCVKMEPIDPFDGLEQTMRRIHGDSQSNVQCSTVRSPVAGELSRRSNETMDSDGYPLLDLVSSGEEEDEDEDTTLSASESNGQINSSPQADGQSDDVNCDLVSNCEDEQGQECLATLAGPSKRRSEAQTLDTDSIINQYGLSDWTLERPKRLKARQVSYVLDNYEDLSDSSSIDGVGQCTRKKWRTKRCYISARPLKSRPSRVDSVSSRCPDGIKVLNGHFRIKTNRQCKFCCKMFDDHVRWLTHRPCYFLRVQTDNVNRKLPAYTDPNVWTFACDHCSKSYLNVRELIEHLRRNHYANLVCNFCPNWTLYNQREKRHSIEAHLNSHRDADGQLPATALVFNGLRLERIVERLKTGLESGRRLEVDVLERYTGKWIPIVPLSINFDLILF